MQNINNFSSNINGMFCVLLQQMKLRDHVSIVHVSQVTHMTVLEIVFMQVIHMLQVGPFHHQRHVTILYIAALAFGENNLSEQQYVMTITYWKTLKHFSFLGYNLSCDGKRPQ
jgi:hypothetical protein